MASYPAALSSHCRAHSLGPIQELGVFFFPLYSNFSNTVPDLKIALFLTDEASISATFTSALQQVAILCSFIFSFSLILNVAQKIFVWLRGNQNRVQKIGFKPKILPTFGSASSGFLK